ncbi:AfsR/SARP family transcriptional regulator [Nonomuraea sp. NPDC003214]
MRFRILGPLVIERDGGELHLGGGLQRVVMALLLLEANRIVPLDRLIEAAWGHAPPGTARNQIQIRVFQLRRALDDTVQPFQVLLTRPPGYLLKVGKGSLDLADFDALVARAQEEDAERAAATLREALALWRGPALADVESDLLLPIAHDLEERRLLARERLADLDLELGRHQQLVGELRRMVQDHPLRERPHGQLMLALYRSGRQAEALDAFRDYRGMLLDTLGLEPGDELRRLELAILNQDASLALGYDTAPGRPAVRLPGAPHPGDAPVPPDDGAPGQPEEESREEHEPGDEAAGGRGLPPVPRQLPPVFSPLSGRDAELERVAAMLRPGGSALPLAAIVGRAGVGKSELALHAAHRAAADFPDGQLYIDLRAGELQPADVLGRFLRALGLTSLPRGLEERSALFRSTVAGSRLLVVLDNAGPSPGVWPLLPGAAPCAALVTTRERPVGLPGRQVLRLDVLGERHAADLIVQDIGPARAAREPDAVRTLAQQCGGLPLALRIAGARLAARPRWRVETLVAQLADSRTALDALTHGDVEVRASLDVSYAALSPRARLLFRRIGLLGCPQVAPWLAAALCDADPADGVPGPLAELTDASLLRRTAGGRYGMHDLVRAFAEERAHAEETREQRAMTVERACTALLALAERVHERHYGGFFTMLRGKGTATSAVTAGLADALIGEQPLPWLDEERAVLLAAVRQAGAHGLDELCWNLAMTAVTLFEAYGHFDDWRSVTEHARRACVAAGNARGEAAMVYSLSSLLLFEQRYTEAGPLLRDAIRLFGDIGEIQGRALALRNLALVERVGGRAEVALARYAEALPLLRAVGDRAAEAHVLVNVAAVHLEGDRPGEAEPLLERALATFRAEGVPRGEAQTLTRIAELALRRGDAAAAKESFARAAAIVGAVHDRIGEVYVLHGLGEAQAALGESEQAEATLRQALALAVRLGERHIQGRAGLSLGLLLGGRGDPEAAEHLRTAHELFAGMGAERWRARAAEALAR